MYCKITLGNIEEHIVVKHFKMYLFGTYKYHNVITMVIKLCLQWSLSMLKKRSTL